MDFQIDNTAKWIFDHLADEDKKSLSVEDIDYVLDLMCDFYEKMGLLDDEKEEEIDINEEEIFLFICALIKKENIAPYITNEQVQLILDKEYEYGVKNGVYNS